jgi:hypothetical protein
MQLTNGLFIPAVSWLPASVLGFPTKPSGSLQLASLYSVIGCGFVESIYPVVDLPDQCVMFGDEDARNREHVVNNDRATRLFGYPYPIVGNVVVFGDSPAAISRDVPDSIIELIPGGIN